MSLNYDYKKIKSILKIIKVKIEYNLYSRKLSKYQNDMSFSEACKNFSELNEIYRYFHHYFWNLAPEWLKEHRFYFSIEKRSFGEDAFHAMWYKLFEEFLPQNVLEIGVYRGCTISLFSLIAIKLDIDANIHGISPFDSTGDSVSSYIRDINYYEDVMNNFDHFNLPQPNLHKGYSTDLEMVNVIKSKKWDLIFIDGNHDFEIVLKDYKICLENLSEGGILVLDDASLNRDYKAPSFSTAGHPGPSLVASKYADKEMELLGAVGHINVYRKK
jgi:cephalosporin hydroxylase